MHIVIRFEGFDELFILAGPKSDNRQTLRLPAGEKTRPVRARQNVDLAGNGPDIVQPTAIGAAPLGQTRNAIRVSRCVAEL